MIRPLVIATLYMLALTIQAKAETISLVTGNDYPPFSDDQLPGGGLITTFITRALDDQGINHTIVRLPWKRAYEVTSQGSFDMTFPYIYNPKRAEKTLFTEKLIEVRPIVFSHANDDHIYNNLQSLSGKTICNPIGYAHQQALQPMVEAQVIHTQSPTNIQACFGMLARKRVDFIALNGPLGFHIIKESQIVPSTFKANKINEFTPHHLYGLIGKAHARANHILERVNHSLRTFKQSNEHTVLLSIYGLTPEEHIQ